MGLPSRAPSSPIIAASMELPSNMSKGVVRGAGWGIVSGWPQVGLFEIVQGRQLTFPFYC